MKIVDTYNDIFSAYSNRKFDLALWEKYADKIPLNLKQKVKSDYLRNDFDNLGLPVLNSLPDKTELLEQAHNAFLKVTENLSQRIMDKFGVDLDVTIVFYLGLCNAAGWATTIDGKSVVLLGIEKIVELEWCNESSMIALIYHELGHIWHFLYEPKAMMLNKKTKAMQQLFREGIAMVFEQSLCNDFSYFHQDINGWLEWCTENETEIKTEYLRRVDSHESVQDFFGDWCSYKAHSDVGYFLGSRFVLYLMKEYNLQEIAGFKLNRVYKEFHSYVNG